MRFILFATEGEAEGTIHALKATPVAFSKEKTLPLFEFAQGLIAISGIGILSAQHTMYQLASEFTIREVWNLGFAGSLDTHSAHASLLPIRTIDLYTRMPVKTDAHSRAIFQSSHPSLSLPNEGQSLISSHFPIHSEKIRDRLSKKWKLVDMEAYGIAYACHRLGIQCRIWKIISDFAQKCGRTTIKNTKRKLSEDLAFFVSENYPKFEEKCL